MSSSRDEMSEGPMTMSITSMYLTAATLTGAVALAAAPMAAASPPNCTDIGSATQCESPGNSQVTAQRPEIQQQPEIIIIHRNHR
jgi:hypothetical protein